MCGRGRALKMRFGGLHAACEKLCDGFGTQTRLYLGTSYFFINYTYIIPHASMLVVTYQRFSCRTHTRRRDATPHSMLTP